MTREATPSPVQACRSGAFGGLRTLGALVVLLAAACQGTIDPTPGTQFGASGSSGTGGAGAAPSYAGAAGSGSSETTAGLAHTTRVARLTHTQYDNTVSDLLYVSARPSASFQPDPVFGGYDNSMDDLTVADRLGRDYRRAAEELAALAVGEPAAYARLVTCAPASAGCAESFVRDFGARAFRRPLRIEETSLYLALFQRGAELVASGDAFRDGVRLVIESMLQSPKFLYRAELTTRAAADGSLALEQYEVAQRLSYMLWNTMPDAALFDAASQGQLSSPEGIAQHAARMLDDPRAESPVADFHSQWLQMGRYEDLTRSETLFPDFSPDLRMREESLAFVRHVVFDLERGYQSLLTAPFTFVDTDLARLYGLSGSFGSELRKAELDPAVRGGILTQIGFLASHAYPEQTSPIHRGVFVHRRILCNPIPDPPPTIDTSEGHVENPRTTREAVEIQTDRDACRGCHALINPPGFAFEHFDAVGKQRTTDRGVPVDTTGTIEIDGAAVSFQSSTDLVAAIARSRQGRECYARNLFRYASGREESTADEAIVRQVADGMSADTYGVKAALLTMSRADGFRRRAPNRD